MDQQNVLIISDDPSFPAAITSHWQSSSNVPSFTVMQGDLCQSLTPNSFDLAVLGEVQPSSLKTILQALRRGTSPVLLVSNADAKVPAHGTNVRVVPKSEAWLEVLVLLANEMLARYQIESQLRRMQQTKAALERQAELGSYMLNMRHGLNNALTSVLGNAELLLLEGNTYPPSVQLQFETIRNMSIRIHEIFQRFTSLEKELRATGPDAERPARRSAASVSAS